MKVLLEIDVANIEKTLEIIKYLEEKAKVNAVKLGTFKLNIKDTKLDK